MAEPSKFGQFEIRGQLIYASHSFYFYVKCFEKFLTLVETEMFALEHGIKIVSEQQFCAIHKHLHLHTHFFNNEEKEILNKI